MSRRLLLFLLALVGTMLSGIIIALLLTGVIGSGVAETEAQITRAQAVAAERARTELGDVSAEAVRMSRAVSASLIEYLGERELAPRDLPERPEVLQGALADTLDVLLLSLERAGASGAFLVLDATVNPQAQNAAHSRAGLYIRNSEPGVPGDTTKLYLRGFPQIAYDNGLSFQSVWDMEFDLAGTSFFDIPMQAARQYADAELSRLYHWGFDEAVDNLGENTLLCSIPLLDAAGEPFGVCGFEIGAQHFRLNHDPGLERFPNAALLLSEGGTEAIRRDSALMAGNAALLTAEGGADLTQQPEQWGGLSLYAGKASGGASADGAGVSGGAGATGGVRSVGAGASGGASLGGAGAAAGAYAGRSGNIRIYPEGSPFADNAFTVTLLVAKADLDAARQGETTRIVLVFVCLFAVGVTASLALNRRFMKPIREGLAAIEAGETQSLAHLPELQAIAHRMQELKRAGQPVTAEVFGGFIEKTRLLTPTERIIFEYYADGKMPEDVMRFMRISVNTLKSHNRSIYAKLGASSRDEVLVYVELIRRAGLIGEIVR